MVREIVKRATLTVVEKKIREMVQKAIREEVEKAYQVAEELYGMSFPRVPIRFDCRGGLAGQVRYLGTAPACLRFNMEIAINNATLFMERTPKHEVAHIVSRRLYGREKGRGHGRCWKRTIRQMGGNDSTCHSYDLSEVKIIKRKRVSRPYVYKCDCTTYNLTGIRHKNVLKGTSYSCKKCRCTIRYSHTI